jgi:uncharacterized protein YllA (UPF0747 family)
MLTELARTELSQHSGQSRLFLDYVSGNAPPFLPSLRSQFAAWSGRSVPPWRQLHDNAVDHWAAVIDAVTESSARLGAGQTILDGLAQAKSRQTRFVVTGQQPGALGGPLYVVYKIATAIAVAAKLEKTLGYPCIPLYWCGSDDTDFQEIRDFHLTTQELSVVASSIAHDAYTTGMPVGDIDTKWDADVWQSTRQFVEDHPGGRTVAEFVDQAFVDSRDHGELAAAVLMRLLGGRFAVVDGRSPEVRRYAKPLFAAYIEHEDAAKEEVAEAGGRLEASGYHSQLTVGQDSGVFLVESGRRRSVTTEQRSLLVAAVESRVETCSPGVILRNLVQDYTFEPLAAILGPAEIAYRAQMGKVYERFDVVTPVLFPRMAATYAPPPLAELIPTKEDARLLLEEPAKFAGATYRSQTPKDLVESVRAFEDDTNKALERLSSQIAGEVPEKSLAKLRGRIKELRGRLEQFSAAIVGTGKALALERWPFLAELPRLIRPGDKPQERRLSSMVPFLQSPGDAGDGLIDLASTHAHELMDGRAHHVVYSDRP